MQIRMKSLALGLMAATATAMLGVGSVAAQEPLPRTTVGWGVSVYDFSPFVERTNGETTTGAGLESSLGALLFVHHWFNRWIGAQADFGYSRPELSLPGQAAAIDLWTAAAGATLRPLGAPRPVAPYAMASVGIVSYGIGGPPLRVEGGLAVDTDRTEHLTFQFGGGVDVSLLTLRDSNVLGLRAEAANLMVSGRPVQAEERGDEGGHSHWRLTVGLHATLPRH
jgi:hypothetical protein